MSAVDDFRARLALIAERHGNEHLYAEEFQPPTNVLEGLARTELMERAVLALERIATALEQGATVAAPKRRSAKTNAG